MYVFEVDTATVLLPDVATEPTPLSIEAFVVYWVFHENVTLPGEYRVDGVAVNDVQTGAGGKAKLTARVHVPFAFFAVSVNTFAEATATTLLPLSATGPTPWLIETSVALLVVHASVTLPGVVREAGVTVKELHVGAPLPDDVAGGVDWAAGAHIATQTKSATAIPAPGLRVTIPTTTPTTADTTMATIVLKMPKAITAGTAPAVTAIMISITINILCQFFIVNNLF